MNFGILTLAHVCGELKGKAYLDDRIAELKRQKYQSGMFEILRRSQESLAIEKAHKEQMVKI